MGMLTNPPNDIVMGIPYPLLNRNLPVSPPALSRRPKKVTPEDMRTLRKGQQMQNTSPKHRDLLVTLQRAMVATRKNDRGG